MKTTALLFPRSLLALSALAAGLFLATAAHAADADLRDPEKNSAIKPEPRTPAWMKRHEGFVEIAKQGGVDLLFMGDSITDFWRRDQTEKQVGGKMVWDREFMLMNAANFGISGDRTQHVLWRLQNGEMEGITPKLVVLMIGTNNTGFEPDKVTKRNTPEQAAEGVKQIVQTFRKKWPKTKILLLAVFPRSEKPDDPARQEVNAINQIISKLDDGKNVRYLDIGPKFLTADGTLTKEIMPDFLHPGEKGYEIWAAAIKEPVAQMMK